MAFVTGRTGASEADVSVARYAFARQIEAREPIGASEAFPVGMTELYFFTQIVGAEEPTDVTHVWIYGGREMYAISLPVEGISWRTWSSKAISPELTGEWTVQVRDADGIPLLSAHCRVE